MFIIDILAIILIAQLISSCIIYVLLRVYVYGIVDINHGHIYILSNMGAGFWNSIFRVFLLLYFGFFYILCANVPISKYEILLIILLNFLGILVFVFFFYLPVLYHFEVYFLFFSIFIGLFFALTARDLFSLFFALVLVNLASYGLTVLSEPSNNSTEVALKIFVLQGISTSFLILGISLVWFFFGVITYAELEVILQSKYSLFLLVWENK